MALIIMPANVPFVRKTWVPPAKNQVNRSGWTGKRKVVRLPGAALWSVSAAVMPISREVDAWPWLAFFTALEGEANSFLMPYCVGQYRRPGTGANPTVSGVQTGGAGGQGAQTLYIENLGVGGGLHAGQVMTLLYPSGNRQLVLLTQNLIGDGTGRGMATFRGAMRETPAAGAAVEFVNPVCQMALTDDAIPLPNDEGVYNFAFDATEDF